MEIHKISIFLCYYNIEKEEIFTMDEFTKEYVEMFKRWNDFEGRSTVREYWMPVLINILVGIVLGALGRAIGIFNFVDAIYGLIVIIPFIALFVRRMHDIGKSGWNFLWILVPLVGWIYVIYLLIQPSY
jgi:uncharacterized membrane protein YhaH (DUF805 family)